MEGYNKELQDRLRKTTFANPACASWYKTESGQVTNNWPGTAGEYVQSLRIVRWEDYDVTGELEGVVQGEGRWIKYRMSATALRGCIIVGAAIILGAALGNRFWEWMTL